MNVTEVSVRLVPPTEDDKLLAYCDIVIDDDIVIRELRIVRGRNGPFAAMPSRKNHDHCPTCNYKNFLLAKFCNECGDRLPLVSVGSEDRLYSDVVHPIHSVARRRLQETVLRTYEDELNRAESLPSYDYKWRCYSYRRE